MDRVKELYSSDTCNPSLGKLVIHYKHVLNNIYAMFKHRNQILRLSGIFFKIVVSNLKILILETNLMWSPQQRRRRET